MPLKAEDATKSPYLRLLVLGAPKVGKTTTVLSTCEEPAYVINCDDESSIIPAARKTKGFVYDNVFGSDALAKLEKAIGEARAGVKEGRYRTIVWDTITSYAMCIEQILADATDTGKGPDGRRYWPEYEKRLRNAINRLFALKAHVIVLSHYIDVGGEVTENQMAKTGPGIVPLLGGKARGTIPALFQDVVFLEKRKEGRVFTTSIDGVWGPGCRSLPDVSTVPADVKGLWRAMNGEAPRKEKSK